MQEGVDVKQVCGPEGKEVFILARSADRQAKEQAMHQRFLERLEDGLRKLESAMNTGHLRDEGLANRRLGRLLEKNWRAAGAFESDRAAPAASGQGAAGDHLGAQPELERVGEHRRGCYILRSNLCDVDPVTLWKRYIQLTEAEWAFRIAKDELESDRSGTTRKHRVRAHILVCFLAYVLWKTLAGWMQRAGLGDARGPCWKNSPRSKAATWSSKHKHGEGGPIPNNPAALCTGARRRPRKSCSHALD